MFNEGKPGVTPDVQTDFRFSLEENCGCLWNRAHAAVLAEALRVQQEEERWSDKRRDVPTATFGFFENLVMRLFKSLHDEWRKALAKKIEDAKTGKVRKETPEEIKKRLLSQAEESGKASRRRTRRKNVSLHFYTHQLYS